MITWDSEHQVYLINGNPAEAGQVRSWISDWTDNLVFAFVARANSVLESAEFADPENPTVDETNNLFIALQDWEQDNRQDLIAALYAATALAFGGLNNISIPDWEIAEANIAEQMRFWENFVAGVVFGGVALNGVFAARTGMYAASVFGAFVNSDRMRQIRTGNNEERRRLEASANHCGDCLEQAALKWQPVGTLRRIGDSECKSRCKCYFEFR